MNLNGWTENNSELRSKIVTHGDPDIICLTETHLKEQEHLSIPGYQFIGCNRCCQDLGRRSSGGIGILFKDMLRYEYVFRESYRWMDNVLGVSVLDKGGLVLVTVFCVYLPLMDPGMVETMKRYSTG